MPKNILYIGNHLQRHGRTATTIDTLAPLLANAGYEVRCASHRLPIVVRFCDMMYSVYRLRSWAHYVLIDTYSTRNFWYAIAVGKLCKILKIKYIPLLHGGNLPQRLVSHKALFTSYLDNAHLVVSPSDYLEFAFAKATTTPLKVIKNNIELAHYPFKKRLACTPTILWVRSFAAIYNPMMALDVLEQLLVTQPHARLTMVGPEKDGSLAACRQRALKDKLPVTFTGLLTKKEWISLSGSHDIFINTSNFDNLPVSIIEAMALGLPVISTRVGGMSHLIKDAENGYLVTANNVDEMVNTVEKILTNPTSTNKLITSGYHTAKQYDWQVIKPQWQAYLA